MRETWSHISRELLLLPLYLLPADRRINADRWLRGREEYGKLQLADYILMSRSEERRVGKD